MDFSNTLLIILTYIFFTLWLLFHNTDIAQATWGNWIPLKFYNTYPAITILTLCTVLLTMRKEVNYIKSEQSIEDAIKYNQLYKQEKEIVLNKLKTIHAVAKQTQNLMIFNIANDIINDFYNNLSILNINEYPEMISVLHSKITEFKLRDNIHIDLEVENNLDKNTLLNSKDIIELFELVVRIIAKKYNSKNCDKKIISLLIRQEGNGLVFEFVYQLFTLINISFVDMLSIVPLNTRITRIIKKNNCTIEENRPDPYTCIIRICMPSNNNMKKKLKILA